MEFEPTTEAALPEDQKASPYHNPEVRSPPLGSEDPATITTPSMKLNEEDHKISYVLNFH